MTDTSPTSAGRPGLLERLEVLDELRPFPAVATQVMAACQDPNANPKRIGAIIECDAGYALRVLRMANSPMYGFSGAIKTVEQAIVVLGFRCIRDIAIAIAGAQVFSQGETAARERAALWVHSLGCAAVARALAPHVRGTTPDAAYLAGVFHDVGKLVLFDLAAEEYQRLTSEATAPVLVERETEAFGITHAGLGLRCGEDWGLPAEILSGIGCHHDPEGPSGEEPLVTLIRAADRLARHWSLGEEAQATAPDVPVDPLALGAEALAGVRAQATAAFEEARQICAA